MSPWSFLLKRYVSLKTELKRLFRRVLKPRIVIIRRDPVNKFGLIPISVTHLERMRWDAEHISKIRR